MKLARRLRGWLDDPGRMHSVDRAWLRMDDPSNLMVVNAVLLLDAPLELERLRELIGERLTGIRRMRTSVVHGQTWDRWADRGVELEQHVRELSLPAPGDDACLSARISELISEPLAPERPLWQLWLIHGYRDPDGHAERSVVLTRVHHSLGDGLAQLLVLLSLTDLEPEGGDNPLRGLLAEQPEQPAQAERALARARAYLREVMPTGMKLLLQHDHALLDEPRVHADARPATLERARRSIRFAGAAGRDLASLLLRRPDSASPFRGRLHERKRVAWSRPIPLDDIKQLGHELGDTVNDVLLAAMTGALRRYLIARAVAPEGVELRTAVPINLRRLAQLRELGNRFGLVFLTLPVGIADPRERLAELHRRMDALKHSVEPVVTWGLLELMGASPKLVEQLFIAYFAARVSFVMTNVPGPERKLYLAGREIEGLMFWVPQSGRVGLGISIFSYAGQLRIGVACDAQLVDDPELLIEKFEDELDALRAQ